MGLIQELNNLHNHVKYAYFMFKNGLSNTRTDYGKVSEEEFEKRYLTDKHNSWKSLKLWEKSEVYKRLVNIMLEEQSTQDFLEVYKAIKDKAKSGDSQAVKTFLMLQDKVKKSLKNDKSSIDDGLEID